uniref:WGS project CBMI000000000 data, contig CS3069_c004797 n=1 Tax=Fusarium clavum TaxID=2594811 RepID=A0A090MES8_9HYPO|nr:unnamed protein product [Fusarium clavum]
MSLPLLTSPVSVPTGGGSKIEPRDMKAIQLNRACEVSIKLENGKTVNDTAPKGTLGHVPHDALEIGVPNSKSQIKLPRLEAARTAAPISNKRASYPAGRAILNMWEDIQSNKALLVEHGLRLGIYDASQDHISKLNVTVLTDIVAFDDEGWETINTPGLPLEKFLELRQIDQNWPELTSEESLIYLRLYTDGPNGPFSKYAGRTVQELPVNRMRQHSFYQDSDTKTSTHYREARKRQYRYSIPMMKLVGIRAEVLPMAEFTLCALLRTWADGVVQISSQAIAEGASSTTVPHRILMAALSRITDESLKRANFPLLGGIGCNWSCPLQEVLLERREWIRYRVVPVDDRPMFVYRCQSKVVELSKNFREGVTKPFVRVGFLWTKGNMQDVNQRKSQFCIQHSLEGLPGLRVGQPLILHIELMEDGKPHPTPWYRHPYHGAWDNSGELHSFCIKVEWLHEAEQRWYNTTLSHTRVLAKAIKDAPPTATPAWRKATMILQVLLNRQYQNPPSYLTRSLAQTIRHVNYDHLNQVISFNKIPRTTHQPPSHVSFDHNLRELFKACQKEWRHISIGPMPPPAWFNRSGKELQTTSYALCILTSKNKNGDAEMKTCAKREGNFHIDDGEANEEMIREGSCYLCWTYWRRPCTWIPFRLGYDDETPTSRQPEVPPSYKGVVPIPFRAPIASPIPAPMSIEEYYNMKQETIDDGDSDLEDEEEYED